MYNSWQSGDWSGNSGGGDWQKPSDHWQQPGGWCEPKPNYPPKFNDDRNDDGDLGWSGSWGDTGDWSGGWTLPGGDGCCCSFDQRDPWHGGGHYGPWQYAFGHLGPWNWGLNPGCGPLPWQLGYEGPPHHGWPHTSDHAELFAMIAELPFHNTDHLAGLLEKMVPVAWSWNGDFSAMAEYYVDHPEELPHFLSQLGKVPHTFNPSGHWWKPGGGQACCLPKPCVEPPELGFKVFRYIPENGLLIDLNDGIGDLGRGNGDPGHRVPWAQEVHDRSLFVGVLNGNPNPHQTLPAAFSLFTDELPFAPTLHSSGPEIWQWVNLIEVQLTDETVDAQQIGLSGDGGYWQKAFGPEDLEGVLEGQVGIRDMLSYEGYLYASTTNNVVPLYLQASHEQGTLIRSKSGEPGTWEEVPRGPGTDDDPFDDPTNVAILTMEKVGGFLVVGTEKSSALHGPGHGTPELWTFDGSEWARIEAELEGHAITEIYSTKDPFFDDIASIRQGSAEAALPEIEDRVFQQPFAGNWDPEGYNLYTVLPGEGDEDDNGTPSLGDADKFVVPTEPIPPVIIDVTPTHVRYVGQGPNLPPDQIPDYIVGEPDTNGLYDAADFADVSPFDDESIVKIFQFDPNPNDKEPGYLYFGTADLEDGATLMRSQTPNDPKSWELITADGFLSEFGAAAVNAPDDGLVPALHGNFAIWSAAVVETQRKFLRETPDDTKTDPGFEDSVLYIGTFNGLKGAGQILKSYDGVNFEFVTQDAFGAENINGFSSMEVIGNEVHFGGASPTTMPDPTDHPYMPDDPFAFDLI